MKRTSLSNLKLNQLFLEAISDCEYTYERTDSKPLLIDISSPLNIKLKVYMYNCTCPPGGRKPDEYKCQLIVPGQKRGTRGNFDYSDGRFILVVGYVQLVDDGVFVIWDPTFHQDFSFSANLQVKSGTIIGAYTSQVSIGTKTTGEIVLAARANNLLKAIEKRISII